MSPAITCVIAALASFAIGGAFLAYILVVSGRTRTMRQDELARSMFGRDPQDQPTIAVVRGKGVRREASMTIGGLRRLAKREQWGLFWSWPCTLTGFALGMQLLCIAPWLADGEIVFALSAASICVPMIVIAWFMPWAALHTKIEADIDEEGPPLAP